ncbi:potassium channel protein [bacterium]|nr:potassium channel protein [bacterium]
MDFSTTKNTVKQLRYVHAASDFDTPLRKLYFSLAIIVALILMGTCGYIVIEGWGPLDALYMTFITLSTVGFREVHDLSPYGRIFTITLIASGVSMAAYSLSVLTRAVIEGEIGQIRELRKTMKAIQSLNNHIIVCGYGGLGQSVVRELQKAKQDFVVVEKDLFEVEKLKQDSILHIHGDASEDAVLFAAGINRAKSLLSLLSTDADNVYTILCARELNTNLLIVARSEDETGETRLKRAGANRILAPYRVAGSRIAQSLTRPHVSDFLDITAGRETTGGGLVIEEIQVPDNCPLVGQTLQQSNLRTRTGAIIAAYISASGDMHFNPEANTAIEAGATMIVLGSKEALQKLSEILS